MYKVVIGLGMKKGLVTIKQAAEILNVSIRTLIRWDETGKLKASRHPINNYRLYRLDDLQNFAKKVGEK